MRRSLFVAVLCLYASPALANWTFSDLSDDMGLAYAGFAKDTDGIELEIYCDDWLPGLVDMTIYTGQSVSTPIEDAIAAPVTLTIDGQSSIDLSMFLDDLDGQLVIYTSNMDTDNFEDALLSMAQASGTLSFASPDQNYVFPSAGARDVIRQLADICPS